MGELSPGLAILCDSQGLPELLVIYAGFVGVRLLSLSAAAYALAHMRLPCRRGIILFLATLMLPFFAYLIPSYLIVFRLGLLDSFWAVCLPAGADSYSCYF